MDAFKAAEKFIEAHVCDPDITDEMVDSYHEYEVAKQALKGINHYKECE